MLREEAGYREAGSVNATQRALAVCRVPSRGPCPRASLATPWRTDSRSLPSSQPLLWRGWSVVPARRLERPSATRRRQAALSRDGSGERIAIGSKETVSGGLGIRERSLIDTTLLAEAGIIIDWAAVRVRYPGRHVKGIVSLHVAHNATSQRSPRATESAVRRRRVQAPGGYAAIASGPFQDLDIAMHTPSTERDGLAAYLHS